MKTWCAIGDSFTYLNDHLDETGHFVKRGYLTRMGDKLPELELHNIGINGSNTQGWLTEDIPACDVYTILLGTNDWHAGHRIGTVEDFTNAAQGTILGNLGDMARRIRALNPDAVMLFGTPIARTDFVYLFDYHNNAQGSYAPEHGQELRDVALGIVAACEANGIPVVNLFDESGVTPANAVKFKRVVTPDGVRDLPYPDYLAYRYDPDNHPYPYPPECHALTYDGLHPTDEGNEILAALLAEKLRTLL